MSQLIVSVFVASPDGLVCQTDPVIHVHEFGIGLERAGKVEACKAAGDVAFVRPLVEIERRVIESDDARFERPVGRDVVRIVQIVEEVSGIAKNGATTFEDRRRPVLRDLCSEGTGAVVAPVLAEFGNPSKRTIKSDVRAVIEKAAPKGHRHIISSAVEDAACRVWDLPLIEQTLHKFIPIVVLVAADLTLDLETLQPGVEDEVDNTRDRVGAVDGRRATGQHFDALDDGCRDAIDVRYGKARIARHEAMAVYEHQRPHRAEAAKIDRGGTCRAGGNELALRRIDLRKPIEDLLHVGGTLQFEFVALDHCDRTDGGQIRTRDARTGDYNLGCGVGFFPDCTLTEADVPIYRGAELLDLIRECGGWSQASRQRNGAQTYLPVKGCSQSLSPMR